jgi:hypothetical protein
MTRADWLLIVVVVCSLPLLYARLWLQDDTASYLRVQTGNDAATVMPLLPDRRLDIEGPLGNSTVEIKDRPACPIASASSCWVRIRALMPSISDGIKARSSSNQQIICA